MTEAAAGLRAEGRDVEYLRAILVPGDEIVFHVLSAGDAEDVREASRRADVEFERVVESVAVDARDVDGGVLAQHEQRSGAVSADVSERLSRDTEREGSEW